MPTSQHRREPLTRDDISRLEKAIGKPRDRLVVWTLLDCGLRISELCALARQDVDFQRDTIRITGKGRRRRTVPMTPRVHALLEHYFALEDTLPLSRRMGHRIVTAIARRAAISKPCPPHVLRHTFAVNLLQRGLSLAAVQRLLGHERLTSTAIYLNLSNDEAIREFREKVSRA